MRSGMNRKTVGTILILSLFLMAADGGGDARDERESLNELQQSLRARIETLAKEQDFLLFQKAMYASDSKYLILNVTAKTGQLKYKNRVLKDFHFQLQGKVSGNKLRTGMLVLDKKTEEKSGRHVLIFGDALILQWKRSAVPAREKNIPFITLTKRDLQSVFYAVEPGARTYVLR